MAMAAGCADLAPEPQNTIIPIGALLPKSGTLAQHGAAAEAALEYAEAQANAYFAGAGATLRVELHVADTRSTAEGAFDAMRALRDDGVHAFVGPYTSEGLDRVDELASRTRALAISPFGGAPELAIAEDNVVRFVPASARLAEAMSAWLDSAGVQAIAFLARTELEHTTLRQAVATRFTTAGGQILGTIDITTNALEANDYRVPLEALAALLADRRDEFNSNGVAVCLLAYEETTTILAQAATEEGLDAVHWLGSEMAAGSDALLANPAGADFAVQVRFTAPRILLPEDARTNQVLADVGELLGRTPDPYALVAYDAFWALTLAVSQAQFPNDPAHLRFVLPQVLAVYNGASGLIALNDADDRTLIDYEFVQVTLIEESPGWQRVAMFTNDGLTLPAD
jgi:branched-chain amino acid transport system substrate-binding protein